MFAPLASLASASRSLAMICSGLCRVLFILSLPAQSLGSKDSHKTWIKSRGAGQGVPSFAEIKRKMNGIITKTRAPIHDCVASELIKCGSGGVSAGDIQDCTHIAEFLAEHRRLTARPAVGVSYDREAYESHTLERVRITLDRNLHCGLIDILSS
ncbi:MAG: VTC domain-containing protein, partial [Planctomycetes bacterium]|nr:VTC domain-containing protein [Planctomycetota bacterium]